MTQRAELPGMSLMEHLDELRRRIVHSAHLSGCRLHRRVWSFHEPLFGFVQAPLNHIGKSLVFTHPMDPLNLYLQVSLIGGAILASPFILFQVWLFIAPGLYQRERRFVVPFMAATVGLFLAGAAFGYYYVLPGALKILIVDFGKNFTPMVTIEEYSGFFLSIILGLGISFEMPVLIFFLAMFGIVSPRFLWKNIRYAILAVFVVAAVICPSPDPWTMCIYALPMLALYVIGIGVAWWVHPSRRRGQRGRGMSLPWSEIRFNDRNPCPILSALFAERLGNHKSQSLRRLESVQSTKMCLILAGTWVPARVGNHKSLHQPPFLKIVQSRSRSFCSFPSAAQATALQRRQGSRVRTRVRRDRPALGRQSRPRAGRAVPAQPFQHDQLEEDAFTANTPIGMVSLRNFIVRFPGKKDGVIVLGTHYETNYPLRNINFVGANDGGSTTGLLMAIADQLRAEVARDKTLDGYSVWLVFFDGEEAFQSWSASDSTYGSRHLAAKWGRDGTLTQDQGLHAGRHDRRQGSRYPARIALDRLAGRSGAAGGEEVRLRALLLPARRGGGRRPPAVCSSAACLRST